MRGISGQLTIKLTDRYPAASAKSKVNNQTTKTPGRSQGRVAVRSGALFDNDMLASIIKPRGPKWLGLARYVPYPLRAAKLSLDLNIFGFWWRPDWHYRKGLTESAKADGATIWYVRWLWFQVSYSRWV